MAAARKMGPRQVEKFVWRVCGGDMHAARVLSVANAVTGALWASALAVSAIGAGLAQARGMSAKHCVKQVDRQAERNAASRGAFPTIASCRMRLAEAFVEVVDQTA